MCEGLILCCMMWVPYVILWCEFLMSLYDVSSLRYHMMWVPYVTVCYCYNLTGKQHLSLWGKKTTLQCLIFSHIKQICHRSLGKHQGKGKDDLYKSLNEGIITEKGCQKNSGKRRKCLFWAISLFVMIISKG